MRLGIIGTGYVGLVTAACFAEYGNNVCCMDADQEKVWKLRQRILPIYEPGLMETVKDSMSNGLLTFTTDIRDVLKDSEILFIAVGTPEAEDGSADLSHVLDVAAEIGRHMTHHMIVVDKSTVPVGTARRVQAAIQAELNTRQSDLTFDMVSNPEFLKEGVALSDCRRPDRIIIGADSRAAMETMGELYCHFLRNSETFICMDIESAEMTKYAANAMLATKISFMNEMSNICERVGANINEVRRGIGSDSRIGYQFIYPGCGYGGSCFPKDVRALIDTSRECGYEPSILRSVDEVNVEQKLVIPRKVKERFGEDLTGLIFAVWGLAFKPDTDDMRMSAAITIIRELLRSGASIQTYDPKAMPTAKRLYFYDEERIKYFDHKYDALTGADAMILVTEWKEFRSPDFEEIFRRLKQPVIFDGRNQYGAYHLPEKGFRYYQIGVGDKA